MDAAERERVLADYRRKLLEAKELEARCVRGVACARGPPSATPPFLARARGTPAARPPQTVYMLGSNPFSCWLCAAHTAAAVTHPTLSQDQGEARGLDSAAQEVQQDGG